MNFKKALPIIANLRTSYISKTMTPNTPAKRPMKGSKTMDSLFYNGLCWNKTRLVSIGCRAAVNGLVVSVIPD